MVDKRSNDIGIAKIHAHFNARIRPATAPVRQIERIADRRIVDWLAVDLQHLKVNLMDVEDVVFERRFSTTQSSTVPECTTMLGDSSCRTMPAAGLLG